MEENNEYSFYIERVQGTLATAEYNLKVSTTEQERQMFKHIITTCKINLQVPKEKFRLHC